MRSMLGGVCLLMTGGLSYPCVIHHLSTLRDRPVSAHYAVDVEARSPVDSVVDEAVEDEPVLLSTSKSSSLTHNSTSTVRNNTTMLIQVSKLRFDKLSIIMLFVANLGSVYTPVHAVSTKPN